MVTGERIEHRRSPRRPAMLPVALHGREPRMGVTENYSEGGLFIATEAEVRPGERISFEVSFPGLSKKVPLSAVVAWRRERFGMSGARGPGVGVKLLFEGEVERRWFCQLVDKVTQGKGPS